MNESVFYRLRMLVAFEIDSFEKQLRALGSSHFPSQVASDFISHLRGELSSQREAIAQIVLDYGDDPKGAGSRLRSEHRKLVEKLDYLDSLENAQTQKVPWSLVPTIERLASELLPRKRLLTASTSELNYGIRWYRSPKSALQQFLILELPAIHKTNAFLHILVGHEFFHPLLEKFFSRETPPVVARLRATCQDQFAKAHGQGDLFQKQRLGEIVEILRHIWHRALEELACDMGCAAVFGPVCVFAGLALASGGNLDEPPSPEGRFYPPWRFRFRSVLRYALAGEEEGGQQGSPLDVLARVLRDADFAEAAEILEQQVQVIKGETEQDTDLQGIKRLWHLRTAYEEVEKSLPSAWNYVKNRAEQMERTWLTTMKEVPTHLRHLELLVPPSVVRRDMDDARGAPASLSAISIAAWLHQLRGEVPDKNAPAETLLADYQRTCRLVLKAFEDVESKRRYDSRLQQVPTMDDASQDR